ncbi:AGR381Cp [Mucor ambiguus]|uniref:Peroxisomal membrane protein PEX14 n=1 Tax=Mucor ambiguus TaxID=91626 RepID=A0A0C9LT44_9FUNG|nr:AGR381Cp [Mucor ambiguus]
MKEDLITSAVSFLSSANVKTADRDKKVEFLRKKGLDDQEIEEAFRRVEAAITPQNQQVTAATHVPQLPPRIPYTTTQVVYYPPAPTPRMTNRDIVRHVLVLGMGSFALTAALTLIIKKFMSKVFSKIAVYQRDRYQQHAQQWKRMESALTHHSASTTNDLQLAQEKLDNSLNRLLQSARELGQQKQQPYKPLRSTIERFTNSLSHNPLVTNTDTRHQFNYQSGFASSYADRYQVDTNHNLTVQSIKSEIRSVKGMLLSRRNFPIVNTAAPSPLISQGFVPPAPTIPSPSTYHPRIGRSFRNQTSTTVEDASPR